MYDDTIKTFYGASLEAKIYALNPRRIGVIIVLNR